MAVCLAVSVNASWAESTAAFTFSEPGKGVTAAGTDGFQFTPLVDIVVTSLGYYDRGRNGLSAFHPVSLFHARTGRQLAWVQVTRGSVRRANFRFEPIQPIVLQSGETYVIAGFTPGNVDPPADTPVDLSIAPQIGYKGYVFDFSDRLELPTNRELFSERTFFGPNFEFHAAPELLSSRNAERQVSHVKRLDE